LNKINIIKAIMLLLSAAVVVAPVIYALNKYEWSIQVLVMLSYSPPNVSFHIEPSKIKFEEEQLFANFKLINVGEVKVEFERLNTMLYGPDGQQALALYNYIIVLQYVIGPP